MLGQEIEAYGKSLRPNNAAQAKDRADGQTQNRPIAVCSDVRFVLSRPLVTEPLLSVQQVAPTVCEPASIEPVMAEPST